ncbi:hypothetical protein J1605_012468 [Eschrichtius robustus]|uniref:Uncharacterized protein n=1 Tax=Eschrichtius robustus TaxID=9764 RepID=A0AB34GMF2_ESCRO|nr:hypothetical protein J1605_012468 [Eschrichtius robustus]
MDPSPRAGLQKAPPQSAQRRAMESSWRRAHWARTFDLESVFRLAPGVLQAVKLYLQRQRLLGDLRPPPTGSTGITRAAVVSFVNQDLYVSPGGQGYKECALGSLLLTIYDPKSKFLYEFMVPCLVEACKLSSCGAQA